MTMLKSIRMVNYKGFEDHTIHLRRTNVLVGANNAGKSTALGALRLIVAMLPQARRLNPTTVGTVGGSTRRGWPLTISATDSSGFSAENLRHDFRRAESHVTVTLSNGVRLAIVWPEIDDPDEPAPVGVFFVLPGDNPGTPKRVAETLVPSVASIPALTPLDDRESAVGDETLRRHQSGRRSSRYFRNVLYRLDGDDWLEFASFVYERTPEITNLSVRRVYGASDSDFDFFYSEPDTGHEREIGWAGDGMQIWVQLLFHLWVQRASDVVLLDEPDVFLHPDLQRRLARTLFAESKQVVLATHSVEILAEAEPGSAVWVDRGRRTSERPRSDGSLALMGRRLGSGFELGIGRALRSNFVLFVEGDDAPILAHLAAGAGCTNLARADAYATVPIGGFSRNWTAAAFTETMRAVGHTVPAFVLLDGDLRSTSTVDREIAALRSAGTQVHVWERRELENYLLLSRTISRVSGTSPTESAVLLEAAIDAGRNEAQIALDTQRLEERGGDSSRTSLQASRSEFLTAWGTAEGRVSVVDAKAVIRRLNTALQRQGAKTLNPHALAKKARRSEMPLELLALLDELESLISAAK